jgi:two-component system, cell cycle sensor histidine kinase and response regulator CckA
MSRRVRLLQVNRSADEADTICRLLSADGWEVHASRIETAGEMSEALAGQSWDVVIADYGTLCPGVGQDLLLVLPTNWNIPLVVISDQARVDRAVEMMRAGASDFLGKDDLSRLPAVVSRGLEEAGLHPKRAQQEAVGRTAAEEALGESELRLRMALEAGAMGLWDWDLPSGRWHWTEQLSRIFGLKSEDFDSRYETFIRHAHPDDQANLEVAIALSRDAHIPFRHEFRAIWPDSSVHWLSGRGRFFFDVAGRPFRMIGIAVDISETRRLEDQLRQAQKMEAVGQLAGGVAHDYNNILTSTLMHLELMMNDPTLAPGLRNSLQELEVETQRAVGLTRQLLMFSRRQIIQVKPVDLNDVVRDLLKMLRRLLGEHITLEFRNEARGLRIEADPGMVEQVVINLCVNSRDAMMPNGGPLTIETRLVELDADAVSTNPEARAGKFVCLSVTDTGSGMSAEVMQRIFEPFFTTKDPGKGTGLGLATVYAIAKQHSGWVEVSSKVGCGATFRVYFPEMVKASTAEAQTIDPQQLRGDETVLVVEDEAAVRRMAVMSLQWFGYHVLEAANGPEALRQWDQHRLEIALLFTDMVMPEGMTGLDLAKRLREANGGLKVIISSGYSVDIANSGIPAGLGIAYLSKPYEVKSLVALVRKCLDQT